MRLLFESRHARLEHDPIARLVRYTRTAEPFTSIAEAEGMFRDIVSVTRSMIRSDLVLLSDLRAAVGRNDDAFEKAIAVHRQALFGGFRKRAALVRTIAGKLQVNRLNRSSVLETEVFDDEAAALAYLAV